jgi:hypothetical protein
MAEQSAEEKANALVSQYAPAISRSMMVNAVAQAMGNASHNATFTQQQHNIIINNSTALNAGMLYAIGAAYAKK